MLKGWGKEGCWDVEWGHGEVWHFHGVSSPASWVKQRKLMLLLSISVWAGWAHALFKVSRSHSLLPFTQSHKKAKGQHNGEKEDLHPPWPTPVTPSNTHTHTQANKHTQLTSNFSPPQRTHTYTSRYSKRAQTRTPSCSALSLLWIPSHVSLLLACHSSPQRYQSLSPRPHNGSSWVAAASVAPAISKF